MFRFNRYFWRKAAWPINIMHRANSVVVGAGTEEDPSDNACA